MKLLIVNNCYNQGSTGKIVEDLRVGLEQLGVQVCVAYGRGPKVTVPHVYRLGSSLLLKIQSLFSKITGFSYRCSPVTTHRFFKIIQTEKPDVVNIQCINANTLNMRKTLEYLKKRGIKTILTPHSEFHYTGGCGHAFDCEQWIVGCLKCPQFKSPNSYCPKSFFFDRCRQQWIDLQKAYNGFEQLQIVGTSPWSVERMKRSPFFRKNPMVTIFNGINTGIFYPHSCKDLREKLHINNEKIILHVTPNFYTPLKGGRFVLEIGRRLIDDNINAKIIIVGYNGNGSDLLPNMIPVSRTKNQDELATYYSLADITLLTSEREVFSMVTAESLCCGTPIVGFQAGGPETVSMPEHSVFVSYGNVELLYEKVVGWLSHKSEYPIPIDIAHKKYARETMNDSYYKLLTRLVKNK